LREISVDRIGGSARCAAMTDIPHPIDGHVSFSAEWDGFPRTIFILDEAVEQAAGRSLDRDAAAAYVHQHIDRFLAVAKRVSAASAIPAGRLITIDELDATD
jgi:hypothetical protein